MGGLMGSTGSCWRCFERGGVLFDRIYGIFWINRIGVGDDGGSAASGVTASRSGMTGGAM